MEISIGYRRGLREECPAAQQRQMVVDRRGHLADDRPWRREGQDRDRRGFLYSYPV